MVVNPLGVVVNLRTVTSAEVVDGSGAIEWFKGYEGRLVRYQNRYIKGQILVRRFGKNFEKSMF